MKELGLDPKQYKYHSSDDKSVTLQHKKGHTVRVALDVLSPKNKAILKALAIANKPEEPQKMADGGAISLPCLNPNCKSHGKPHPNCRCYSGGESFAKGGKVSSHFCSEPREHRPDCEYARGGKVDAAKEGQSMQGMDVRRGDMNMAKKEAKGRAEEERFIKPKLQGMADGGQPQPQNPAIDTIVPDSGYGKIIIMKKADGGEVRYHREEPMNEAWNKDKPQAKDSVGNMMPAEQCFDNGGMVDKAQKWFAGSFGEHQEDPQPNQPQQPQHQDQNCSDSTCKACGGPVKMARGGLPPVDSDDSSAPEVDNQPQPQAPPVPMADNPNVDQNSAIANQAAASLYTPEQARKDEAAGLVKDADQFGVDNLAGHIKPKTYADLFHDKSTFGKLSGLFGVIAGGMGSGLTHQPNAALQMMDKIIANDLEAQKANVSNKQNMWNSSYNHMLQEAQARGLDTNSKLVQQEAAEKANTVANMNTNQGFLGQMALKISNMPPGPAKEAYKKALYMSAQGVDLKHATLADQLATKMTMFDKSGRGWNALQQQNQQGQPGQAPQAPQGGKGEGASNQGQKYKLLSPGAEDKYEDIMNDLDPMWSKNKDLVSQQYTQAQQAEKILNGPAGNGKGGIDDVMDQMLDKQKNMGVWGHLHSKTQASPGILGETEGAISRLVPDTKSEKEYNALKTTLESDLGTALNGIMTPTDVHDAVSKYAPAYQDDAKAVQWKKEQLVNLIRKALHTSALTGSGLMKK